MTKSNIVLFVVLLGVMGAWVAGRESGGDEARALAPRLFPTLNPEYVDAIQIAGGWQGTEYVIARRGSEWFVASGGGYDANADAAEKFLDAVVNLRRDNEAGQTEEMQKSTHTDPENGRLVRLLGGGKVICAFRVGKTPKGSNEEIYVRIDDKKEIYRTRTILTKDRERAVEAQKNPFGGGVRGFEWHNYVNNLSTRWVKTDIWDLKGAEVQELHLHRTGDDSIDVRLIKKADDKWNLVADGKEPVPGDADVADAIINPLRGLRLADVVGLQEQEGAEYGFDAPTRTLVLTLRKKVEKKAEPKEDGDEKKDEPKEEYVTFKRILEVGKKITRKKYDSYSDKFTDDEFYAVRISGEFEDEAEQNRSHFVFLVNSYGVDPLGKKLEDFKQKADEEDKDADKGDGGGAPKKDDDSGDKKDEDAGKKEEPAPKDDDGKKEDPAPKDPTPKDGG